MDRRFEVTLTGKAPGLLMHADDIAAADQMEAWKKTPAAKRESKAGDDRSPAWRWIGYLYHDEKQLVLPYANIMRCLMQGGASVPTGKRQQTFKAQTQSGMMCEEPAWPLLVKKKPIGFESIEALKSESDFAKHEEVARALGFELYAKRARIGASKHIRIRARFPEWSSRGVLVAWDPSITLAVLKEILDEAGNRKGIGDWRPSSPQAPGPFGRFSAEVKEV